MKKPIFSLASAFFLAGCAAPMSGQVASWALEGVSILTTERALVDHGASLVAQKDCAIWRGIKGEAICMDGDPVIPLAMKARSGDNALDVEGTPEPASLADFETAAGGFDPGARGPGQEAVAAYPIAGVGTETASRIRRDHGPAADVMEFVDAWAYLQGLEAAKTAAVAAESSMKISGFDLLSPESRLDAGEFVATGTETASSIRHDHGPAADVMEFVDAWAYLQGLETAKPATVAAMDGPDPAALADFETAALDLPSSESFGLDSSRFAAAKMAWRRSVMTASDDTPPATASGGGETAIGAATPGSEAWKTAEAGSESLDGSVFGLYFVIGSLSRVADVNGFPKRRWQLGSQVVVTRLDGRELYREVVGPFPRSQRAAVRSQLTQAGVRDAWLAFLEPDLWRLVPPARVEETLAASERQIAALLR